MQKLCRYPRLPQRCRRRPGQQTAAQVITRLTVKSGARRRRRAEREWETEREHEGCSVLRFKQHQNSATFHVTHTCTHACIHSPWLTNSSLSSGSYKSCVDRMLAGSQRELVLSCSSASTRKWAWLLPCSTCLSGGSLQQAPDLICVRFNLNDSWTDTGRLYFRKISGLDLTYSSCTLL